MCWGAPNLSFFYVRRPMLLCIVLLGSLSLLEGRSRRLHAASIGRQADTDSKDWRGCRFRNQGAASILNFTVLHQSARHILSRTRSDAWFIQYFRWALMMQSKNSLIGHVSHDSFMNPSFVCEAMLASRTL